MTSRTIAAIDWRSISVTVGTGAFCSSPPWPAAGGTGADGAGRSWPAPRRRVSLRPSRRPILEEHGQDAATDRYGAQAVTRAAASRRSARCGACAVSRSATREGWTVLHDRALPTGNANVDHLLVSPGGVVIVLDSKKWSARWPLRVEAGRLMHGDRDVTRRLNGIRHEARTVARALGCPVIPLVSMEGAPLVGGELVLDGIRIVPADRTVPVLRSLARRHRAVGEHPGQRAAHLFPRK